MDEQTKEIIDAVREMRRCQRDYFKTRSREAMQGSMKWEKRVDELLVALDGDAPRQMALTQDRP